MKSHLLPRPLHPHHRPRKETPLYWGYWVIETEVCGLSSPSLEVVWTGRDDLVMHSVYKPYIPNSIHFSASTWFAYV